MVQRFKDKRITLIVTGSIASYKAAELTREFVSAGAHVQVVMTHGAREFISPLTFQALSGLPVRTDLFDEAAESSMSHIRLAEDTDLVVVAPATADFLARMAAGRAGDLPGAMLLVTRAPIVVFPAMNVRMWEHAITQRNVATLREMGIRVLEPEEGELACGWTGKGRLATLENIVAECERALSPQDLVGRTVYVTAGPTREAIDPIRFLSNTSSGKMGYALAENAWKRGASVVLISGPVHLPPPPGVQLLHVESAEQMRAELQAQLRKPAVGESVDVLLMVAAVSDKRPAERSANKLKEDKTTSSTVQLVPNPDILREIGEQRHSIEKARGGELRVVGFCAESGDENDLLTSAREKLSKKRCDIIVANLVHESFVGDTTRIFVVRKETARPVVEFSGRKFDAAARILDEVAKEE